MENLLALSPAKAEGAFGDSGRFGKKAKIWIIEELSKQEFGVYRLFGWLR